MSDFNGLWQLKLDQISNDSNYIFTALSALSEFADHSTKNMSMCYMKGVDKLLTVGLINNAEADYPSFAPGERGHGGMENFANCGIFDFGTNKMINIDSVGFMSISCSMVYDYHNRSKVYLLSNTGELASYHVFKDKWINLYYDSNILYPKGKKPILWLDNKNTNILYYAGLKVADMINGYDIYIYSLDVRSNDKKWNRCFEYWEDLRLPNYHFAQLFK